MINCPKCQVPNQDNATVCATCGATLAGQQFAAALDQAQQQMGQPPDAGAPAQPAPPAAAAAPPAAAPPPPAAAPFSGAAPGIPVGAPMDPAQAQAEINQFMAEQKARKRTKSFIIGAIALIIVGAGVFWFLHGERKRKKVREVFTFFQAFRNIDDEDTATFWKCTVRAKHRDVRLAKDTLEITDGLTKAFNNYPKSQPDNLKDKCVPMITGIIEDLDKLKPPKGFQKPINNVKNAMEKVRKVFLAYARRIDKRKKTAAAEREIKKAGEQFHLAYEYGGDVDKALIWWNIMNCAVPELPVNVRKIKKGPDTQYAVQYISSQCYKKDVKDKEMVDPIPFANKVRKECYEKRNVVVDKKDKEFKEGLRYMSGDNRDLQGINYCFKRANQGFDRAELKAVAEVFVEYNKARGSVLQQLEAVKKELAD